MAIVGIVVYRRTNALRMAEIERLEKARREEFLRNLETVIERHLSDESFNVDVMASDLFLSRSTLTRRMKNYINESPNDFIRKKRMMAASKMLEDGVLSITEISYKVGFSYPSYFTKCFKEYFGVTPSEFIKH
jgi:AraC-like DNA-binding protein